MFICSCLSAGCHGVNTGIGTIWNADKYTLQALKRLQEAATFIRAMQASKCNG